MIRDILNTTGRAIKLTVIAGTVLTTTSLVVIGAKLPGWFGIVKEVAVNYQLDAREADLKRREDALLDKREAELKQREQIIEERTANLAVRTSEIQNELAQLKQETVKAEAAKVEAIRAKKQALEASQRVVSPPQIIQANVNPPTLSSLDKAAQFCGQKYAGIPNLIQHCYDGYRNSPVALATLN